jgi:hypothetical protein
MMASHLIVAHRTVESPRLFAWATRVLEEDPEATYTLLIPARPVPLRFEPIPVEEWPLARGTRRARSLGRRMLAAGARTVEVRPGPPDPAEAIEEVLSEHRFLEVLISTRRLPLSSWLRLDLPRRVALRHPELRVHHVVAPVPEAGDGRA